MKRKVKDAKKLFKRIQQHNTDRILNILRGCNHTWKEEKHNYLYRHPDHPATEKQAGSCHTGGGQSRRQALSGGPQLHYLRGNHVSCIPGGYDGSV